MWKITINDSFESDSSYYIGVGSGVIDNTGSFTFTSEMLTWESYGAPNGLGPTNKYFDIIIKAYDPVIRTLSNDKKVMFLGVSYHIITVTLVA